MARFKALEIGGSMLRESGDSILAWTGNHASIIDFPQQDLRQMHDESPPVLADLRRDGIDLAGTPLRELWRSGLSGSILRIVRAEEQTTSG